jgi:hypothetical protein
MLVCVPLLLLRPRVQQLQRYSKSFRAVDGRVRAVAVAVVVALVQHRRSPSRPDQALRSQAMPEFFKQFDTVLIILLGWLLGLLTPGIAERIRRPYRRRDLMRAVVDELLGLQHTMAAVAYRIRARRAEVTDGFLDEVLPILESYNGPDRNQKFIEGIKNIRKGSEEQRATVDKALRKPNIGMALRQYSVPLFATQVADLVICGLDFQRAVLHIRYHLDLYNQLVSDAQRYFDKTFTKLDETDRQAILTNQEDVYRDAGGRAEIIMRAVADLCRRYGFGTSPNQKAR